MTPAITFKLGQAAGSVTAPTGTWSTISDSLYDLVPSTDYEWTKYDSAEAANACDNGAYLHGDAANIAGEWAIATDPGITLGSTGLCDESWTIGESGYSCVKITQRLTRPMTPTSETKCDFAIDYV